MSSSADPEETLDSIRAALTAAERPVRGAERLPLPIAMAELEAWLSDDRQWSSAYASNWKSLLRDVEAALDGLGPKVRSSVLQASPDGINDLQEIRRRLAESRSGPDDSLRRRLAYVCKRISTRLDSAEVLTAAFEDLCDAAQEGEREGAEEAARQLLQLGIAAGQPVQWFPVRLRSILGDDALDISILREDVPEPEDPDERAGLSPAERLKTVELLLERPADTGHVIAWMDFRPAKVGWPPFLNLGERVAVYDGSWLSSCFTDNSMDQLPDEVRANPHPLRMLTGHFDHESGEQGPEARRKEPDEIPAAYLRVDLGKVRVADSQTLTMETADSVASLASLFGLPPSIWRAGGSWTSYVDGRDGPMTMNGSGAMRLSVEDHVALDRREETERALQGVADLLGPHLPVRDPDVAEACRLLGWLREARQAPPPARLLLCGRVIEQVSGWAGVADASYFNREHLRLAWADQRVRLEMANTGRAVEYTMRGSRDDPRWSEIYPDRELFGRMSLPALLRHLPWLVQELPQDHQTAFRARRLNQRTESGAATKAWLLELDIRYQALEARARRNRNALVHGGPISEDSVAAVVDFVDEVAAIALNRSVYGRLTGKDLIDYFLARREDLKRCRRRLTEGEHPSTALFWDDPTEL